MTAEALPVPSIEKGTLVKITPDRYNSALHVEIYNQDLVLDFAFNFP